MDVKRFRDGLKQDIKAELRPRKLLRTAFVPQTKGLLTPIKEVFQVFVTLIAQIFIQAKLISKDHPSARGDVHGFGAIWLMIIDASSNVKFKRENLYQIVVFYGIVGMLVFGILDLAAFLMHLSLGHAHADTIDSSTLFTEAGGTPANDQAPNWINTMFLYNTPVAPGGGLPGALGAMLQIYNSALLALGTAYALYQIMHLFVESAHHGKFGGKNYSDLYAPIRLVIGIGLLVPTSSGYNSAEIIAITLAKWGSGLASHVWVKFENNINTIPNNMSNISMGEVNTLMQTLVVDETCMIAYRSAKNNTDAVDWNSMAQAHETTSSYVIDFGKSNSDSYCGSLTIPKEVSLTTQNHFEQAFVGNNGILSQAHTAADMIYQVSGGGQTDPSKIDPEQNPLSADCQQQDTNAGLGGTCDGTWASFVAIANTSLQTAQKGVYDDYKTTMTNSTNAATDDWTKAGYLFLTMTHNAGILYEMENAQMGIALPNSEIMSVVDNKQVDCSGFF